MPLSPEEQALVNRLNQQFPRGTNNLEAEFRRNSLDRQVADVMQSARNLRAFEQNRLMVPSEAELKYRSKQPPPTQNYLKRPASLEQNLTRQPRPSSAAPPPTPNTSGARAAPQTVTAPPPPATPRSPLPNNNPTPGTRFSNIPMPAAKLTGALAVVDFGFRVFQGVPPQKAAVETGGGVVGGVVGGALGGPIGGVVGGLLGGAIGGKIADFIFKESAPKKAETPTQPKIGKVPFNGGQLLRVGYKVTYSFTTDSGPAIESASVWGNVAGIRGVFLGSQNIEILCHGEHSSDFLTSFSLNLMWVRVAVVGNNEGKVPRTPENPGGSIPVNPKIISITRIDGKPDTGGNPSPLPIPQDNRLPESLRHPGNQDFAPPSAVPGGAPAPNNYAPGGNVTKDNPSPRGDSPDRIPHGGPKGSLHPDTMRNLLGPPLPAPSPAPAPKKAPEPQDQSYPPPLRTPTPNGDLAPSGAPNPGAGSQFKTPDSITLRFPGSEPVTTTVGGEGVPDAFKPYPVNNPPAPGTGNTPDAEKTTTDKQFQDDLKKRVDDLALGLVGLTVLIKGLQTPVNTIANNTTPKAIENAVVPGVCRTTQPGGCTTNAMNNAVNQGNQDLLNKLGLPAGQAADLLLLGVINDKLGNKITGGLSGGLGRLSNFLGIDRIFNLINFMANLHNAFMLSNSLKFTLLEMLSSVGNATGLLQTSEGENVDLNAVYNKGIRDLLNSVLGDEQAARLEIQFRRANRIYQAAANSTNAVSSMISSLGNVVEIGAEYGGKIGNALKAAGAVHEKAYQWMAEKFDAKTSPFIKYSQTTQGVTTVLETINEIAESVVEGQQAATEFQKANTEFIKAVADVEKNPGIENKAVAIEVAKQKENATKDPTGEDETGLFSFLTDL